MKDAIKADLDAIFQRNTASIGAAVEAKHIKDDKEADFLREFMEARDEFIRPAMQEIGQYIKGKGYDFEITANDDQSPIEGRGSSVPADVSFTIFLGGRSYRKDEHPSFSVICDKPQQLVRFHECTHSTHTGGHSGAAGEAKLSTVTREFVQERITKLVSDVFGRDASAR